MCSPRPRSSRCSTCRGRSSPGPGPRPVDGALPCGPRDRAGDHWPAARRSPEATGRAPSCSRSRSNPVLEGLMAASTRSSRCDLRAGACRAARGSRGERRRASSASSSSGPSLLSRRSSCRGQATLAGSRARRGGGRLGGCEYALRAAGGRSSTFSRRAACSARTDLRAGIAVRPLLLDLRLLPAPARPGTSPRGGDGHRGQCGAARESCCGVEGTLGPGAERSTSASPRSWR